MVKSGDKLRALVKPTPNLEPEPMPNGLIGSLLRATHATEQAITAAKEAATRARDPVRGAGTRAEELVSISGSIEVNGQEVGHWEASRVETGAVNTYACVVDWTPKDWVRWNGQRYPFWSGGRRANGGKEITHAHRHAFVLSTARKTGP
ncbi:hypothetical protein [Aeromicrobium sp. UC242_57]|uniref:hypothetical protein n=1 Tax=Aeromicrobium sp. UC242_57 TaxID=3374624 RepID=UPI00378BF195